MKQHYDEDEYISDEERGNGKKILMVAEKNSIAEAIAYAIGSRVRAKKGRMAFYYFDGVFQGKPAHFTVTATNGHLFNRDFPPECQDWSKIDPIELFNARTVKKPASKSSAVALLQRVSKGIDTLVLWLDNDREGENICFEVNDICNPRNDVNLLRAKFSSITQQDLLYAYNQLKFGPNKQEALSVDARQVIDLKIGVAFSRLQTMYFQEKYKSDQLVTFGPCQTPTLGFCVQRHEEIATFVPKTFYTLKVIAENQTGFAREINWSGQPIWKEQEAKSLVQHLTGTTHLDVVSCTSTTKSKPRPDGINTVAMLKFASSFLGVGPQQAMHMAEHLYLSGYISYPRTETTAYPAAFPTQQIVSSLRKYPNADVSNHAKRLYDNIQQPKQGIDKGDHPPITPTSNVPTDLQGQEKGLYEYLVKMFLASHSGDCKYAHTKLEMRMKDQSFKLVGNTIIDPGFTKVATWLEVADSTFDPKSYIGKDNKVKVNRIEYTTGLTSPPGHLTETELIGLMDKHGIGTDASMATHINNIGERQYVTVEAGRRLVPTELGMALVRGYKRIDPDLVAPQLRSNIEKKVDQIAKGLAEFQPVIDEIIGIFLEKYKNFRSRIKELELNLAPASKDSHRRTEEPKAFTKCGICNRYMTLIGEKLKCDTCDKSYSLLTDCKYRAFGTQECPLDKFQLVMCQSNKSPYITTAQCPKCFKDSPLLDTDQCVCNLCPAKNCEFSKIPRTLGVCKECKTGELVLEPYLNKGSTFSVSCNECWCLYQLIPAVTNVKMATQPCESCNLLKLSIQVKDNEAIPGFDKDKMVDVCIFCNAQTKLKMVFATYGQQKRPYNKQLQQANTGVLHGKPQPRKQYGGANRKQHQNPQQRQYDNTNNQGTTLSSYVDALLHKKK